MNFLSNLAHVKPMEKSGDSTPPQTVANFLFMVAAREMPIDFRLKRLVTLGAIRVVSA